MNKLLDFLSVLWYILFVASKSYFCTTLFNLIFG